MMNSTRSRLVLQHCPHVRGNTLAKRAVALHYRLTLATGSIHTQLIFTHMLYDDELKDLDGILADEPEEDEDLDDELADEDVVAEEEEEETF